MQKFNCIPWVDLLNEGLCPVFSANCSESFVPACPVSHVSHGGPCLKWHCVLDPNNSPTNHQDRDNHDVAGNDAAAPTAGQIVGYVFLALFLLVVFGLALCGIKRGFDNVWHGIVNGTTRIVFNLRTFLSGRLVESSFEFYHSAQSISMVPPSAPVFESTVIDQQDPVDHSILDQTFHSLESMDVDDPPNYSEVCKS